MNTFLVCGLLMLMCGAVAASEVDTGKMCGPVCMMFCENGMVNDENGCPTCECRDAADVPTERLECPVGTRPTRRTCDVKTNECGEHGVCTALVPSGEGICCINRRSRRPNKRPKSRPNQRPNGRPNKRPGKQPGNVLTGECPAPSLAIDCENRRSLRPCETDADCRKVHNCCEDSCGGKVCRRVRTNPKRIMRNRLNKRRRQRQL